MGDTRKSLVRELNDALVLDAVRTNGSMSRAELARLLSLSGATVTGITARLLEAGLLIEASFGDSVGGRPPRMLALNPDGARVVGASISQTTILAVTLDLIGSVLDSASDTWDGHSPESAEDVIASLLATLEQRSDLPLSGLAITLSGVIDDRAGSVRHSGLLGWDDVALGASLTERLSMPVRLEGRPNALAASIMLFGTGREIRNALFVTTGHSLGVSVVVAGRVWNENRSPVGGLAHTKVVLADSVEASRCHCGAKGCLETVASEWALRDLVRRLGYTGIDDAVSRVESDVRVASTFESAGRYLGQMIGNLATIAAPEQVVLGGETIRLGRTFLDPLRQELQASSALGSDWTLSVCDTSEQTWAAGAGLQMLAAIFQSSHGT